MSAWFIIVVPIFTSFCLTLLLLYYFYYRSKKTKSLELNLIPKSSPPVISNQVFEETEKGKSKRISERIRSSSFIQMLEKRDSQESRPKSQINGSKSPNLDFLVLPRSSPSPNGHSSSSSISSSTLSLVESTTDSVNRLIVDEQKMKDCRPSEIEFTLNYFSSTSTLHVTLIKANHLPIKYLNKNYESFIKVSFKSMSKISKTKRYKTKCIANSASSLTFDEAIPFNDCPFNELKNQRLRIALYVKMVKSSSIASTLTSSGKVLIGDIYVPLSRPDLEPDTLIGIREKLSSACQLTGKRGPLLMSGSLGFLKISLEYLTENQRIKIMIRRGQHFPPATNSTFALLGSPEHFVIVSLMKNQESVVYKETKSVLGVNPSFNQVFLFYLDQLDIDSSGSIKKSSFDDYWIQIVVMRGKYHTKDGLVGHVLIGNDTSLVGSQHWNQVLSSPSEEVTKWHAITDLT